MKRNIAVCLLVALLIPLAALSNKEKKNKVKSTTVMMTIYENGKARTYKESYEEFDRNGNTILYIDYYKDGTIHRKEAYTYDNEGNKLTATITDSVSKKDIKKAYKYTQVKDKSLLLEETESNSAGVLLKKTVYSYTISGKKATETVSDGSGKPVKKIIYTYNSKNMKVTRQVHSGTNVPESLREWQYEYF
jgi:hypothetical protein